jgi:hypothetical protein
MFIYSNASTYDGTVKIYVSLGTIMESLALFLLLLLLRLLLLLLLLLLLAAKPLL